MTLPPVIHSRGSLLRGAQQRQLALPRAQFVLDAVQVGALYKSRWQVELFFPLRARPTTDGSKQFE
jgi:IS4 transposase